MAKNIAVIGDSESIKGFAAIGMDIYPCDTSGAAGAEPFGDENDIRSYALDAVNTLKAEKIVNGDQNNNFNPLANTTRAEAAVIIYNVLSK